MNHESDFSITVEGAKIAHQEQDPLEAFRQPSAEDRAEIPKFSIASAAFDQANSAHIVPTAAYRPQ